MVDLTDPQNYLDNDEWMAELQEEYLEKGYHNEEFVQEFADWCVDDLGGELMRFDDMIGCALNVDETHKNALPVKKGQIVWADSPDRGPNEEHKFNVLGAAEKHAGQTLEETAPMPDVRIEGRPKFDGRHIAVDDADVQIRDPTDL